MRGDQMIQGKRTNESKDDEPDYSSFLAKPVKPGPFVGETTEQTWDTFVKALTSSEVVSTRRNFDVLFTQGRVQLHGDWKFGPQSVYKKNALIQMRGLVLYTVKTGAGLMNFESGDFALAIISDVDPANHCMDLQIVEEFNNRMRPLNKEETRRFDQHESMTLSRGERLLGRFDKVRDPNAIPIPPYVSDEHQTFFFTIQDSNGMIRVANATRVSNTEVVFSRAD